MWDSWILLGPAAWQASPLSASRSEADSKGARGRKQSQIIATVSRSAKTMTVMRSICSAVEDDVDELEPADPCSGAALGVKNEKRAVLWQSGSILRYPSIASADELWSVGRDLLEETCQRVSTREDFNFQTYFLGDLNGKYEEFTPRSG
ncbi:hypothetical protein C8R47DRAFT_1202880 [Mycena vitilis]|nr:hypothetical protein C8R47DRAFT_1202880 [Mycena vitilis]